MQPARSDEGDILALISVRFDPSRSFKPRDLCLTQAQALRLRIDLDHLLSDPRSWLFVTPQSADDGETQGIGE